MKSITNIYRSALVKKINIENEKQFLNIFDGLEIGVLKWDYKKNLCYVNDYLIKVFDINPSSSKTIHDYLGDVLDESTRNNLVLLLDDIRNKKTEGAINFPMKKIFSMDWFYVKMFYDKNEDTAYAIFQKHYKIKNNNNQSFKVIEQFIDTLSTPIFFISNQYDVLFANESYHKNIRDIHLLIEETLSGNKIEIENFEFINHFESFEESENSATFLVSYHINNVNYDFFIVRENKIINDKKGILYTHQPVRTEQLENNRLRKILRANELFIEIRDIVDHADDLNEVFHYLLSKIHTVIPDADRSCILRLDDQERLYLFSSYGFHDQYIKEFKFPFTESYAYMNIGNDFSKSVIIDDIQNKYGDLFPDLKKEHLGFKIESNVTGPLLINNKLYGIVSVDSHKNRVFDDVDLKLLDFIKVQLERAIEKFKTYTKIKKNVNIDSLTGSSNRRHLLQTLPEMMKKADLNKQGFSFVIFDLDKLKIINDECGHMCGDRALQQFSFVIQNSIRENDFFARIGGDEFVGLFNNIDDNVLIQRILNWKKYFDANPLEYKGKEIKVEFSFGISKYPEDGQYFSSLLELADERMYQQKRDKKAAR